MIKLVDKNIIDTYIKNETYDFAIEAYNYNSNINNWSNKVFALYDNDTIVGLLYYRYIDDKLIQLVNVYSKVKGGGTKLFKEFLKLNFEYIYFYMGKNAVKFYESFGIKPSIKKDDFMFTFIDRKFNNVQPEEYREFILSKTKI